MPGHAPIAIRLMQSAERDVVLDLWVASWQAAYPAIDFAARRAWMGERLADHERDGAQCLVALSGERIGGMMVLNATLQYLDQIAVDPREQGRGAAAALIAEAKRLSPCGFGLHVNQDNAPAIRFYEKHGLETAGTDVNPRSGAPIFLMRWAPAEVQPAASNCSLASRA